MGNSNGGLIKRTWVRIAAWSAGTLLVAGFVAGIIFWGGLHTGIEYTNKLDFCISCHSMEHTVYQEYKESVHYRNRVGVQAVCADCHVPHSWGAKWLRKLEAWHDVYQELLGSIDTPEQFAAKRWVMANREWDRMRANDSAGCRNCHSFENMELSEQDRSARKKHGKAEEEGKTCIDCHKGIAHKYPEEPVSAPQEDKS